MINAHHVDPEFAHLGEVAPRLLLRAEIIARRIRLEWSVGGALDEKFPVALEEELGERTDADRRSQAHKEHFLVHERAGRNRFGLTKQLAGWKSRYPSTNENQRDPQIALIDTD